MNFAEVTLTLNERQDIEKLLSQSQKDYLELEDLWQMMDMTWDKLGCDNKNLDCEKIELFYAHPIWILNGLFIEQDVTSMSHRQAISKWISHHRNIIQSVIDYGGGFGTLARLISENEEDLVVDIFEPCPSEIAIRSILTYPNTNFVKFL